MNMEPNLNSPEEFFSNSTFLFLFCLTSVKYMDDFILFQDFVVNGSLPDPPNLMQISLFVTYVKFVVVAFFLNCIKT